MANPVEATLASTAPAPSLRALFEGRSLTPVQRRIARCLIEHDDDADSLSSAEVGALASVSQASVVRFAVALGYGGYPELRKAMRRVRRHAATGEDQVAARNSFQEAVAAEVRNLRHLEARLADPSDVLSAGRLLSCSRPLVALGLRASAPLAGYFAYFAAKVHPDVRLVDEGGSRVVDLLEQAREAGASALVAFDLPRWPVETTDALRLARSLGLSVVTVTDAAVSPQAESSDILLVAAVGTSFVYDSHAAPMVLTMALVQAICDADPGHVQERMEAFEVVAGAHRYFHRRPHAVAPPHGRVGASPGQQPVRADPHEGERSDHEPEGHAAAITGGVQ